MKKSVEFISDCIETLEKERSENEVVSVVVVKQILLMVKNLVEMEISVLENKIAIETLKSTTDIGNIIK